MINNACYKLIYYLDGNINELVVEVKLVYNKMPLYNGGNIYKGIVIIDGIICNDYKLDNIVNALFAVNEIGRDLKNKLKEKYRKEKKSFRLKKEESFKIDND